jgi:hypothetical protein
MTLLTSKYAIRGALNRRCVHYVSVRPGPRMAKALRREPTTQRGRVNVLSCSRRDLHPLRLACSADVVTASRPVGHAIVAADGQQLSILPLAGHAN